MLDYRRLKLLTVTAVGAVCGVAINIEAYWLFAAAILVGSLVLLALRRRAPEVVSDERDYQIAGTSAMITLQFFAWIGLCAALLLFWFEDRNPQFAVVAGTLTVTAAGVMILYGLLSLYLRRFQYGRRRLFAAFAAILVIATLVLALRFVAGEDDWICDNGAWVMHGQPDTPAPSTPCPEIR